ncbi:exodeoxyribonuclease V subunit alpha [Dyella sp.]|jgi:exodeoxyribonuclease V alpha subunit|uniref:exodeoxyribonuclease V subunit alpha n=1 Tax=Dyella sp. TaxID=1869338 RepID=UPI002D78A263|nr:exodeoxyribonuclease V subunit alpha [Dyella sp.]HET6431149.1 exodeoxyribonuclease V subunit alpha [Dyella sp.]
MSAYRFEPSPLELTTDAPWRPLDRAVLRWTLGHGGSPLLAKMAAWASYADGEGDTALPLSGDGPGRHGMPRPDADALLALRAEPLVGDGRVPTPYVIDADDRFYLWRNHAHEVAVARAVRARRAAAGPLPVDESLVDSLFHGERSEAVQRQREAVAAVGGRRLFVLTGGPGTGKTTTVLRMLLALQRSRAETTLSIQVAAPTGKAAQRLVQSLRQGKQALAARLGEDWSTALAAIPDTEALTLHRLLGYDPRRNRFTRDVTHPLAADVVVVDEASMVDLAMLRGLLDAVRPQATLVLVGDADQLTSVAAGSVLMDLVGAFEADPCGDLVRLEHSFRAERQLVPINRAVRVGDGDGLRAAMASAGDDARWREVADVAALRRALAAWCEPLAALPIRPELPPRDEARTEARAVMAVQALRALAQRQLLAALREDGFGALALNGWIEQRLKQLWGVPPERTWYAGRAVLVSRNDYAARLYNGDVGLCLAEPDGSLRVWFETVDEHGRASARSFAPGTLPPHEGGFAITVHKSQGSEYDLAAVLLPPDPQHRLLSRQLLYTGLSRAKRQVELWGTAEAVAAALDRPVQRAGGLAPRLSRTGDGG